MDSFGTNPDVEGGASSPTLTSPKRWNVGLRATPDSLKARPNEAEISSMPGTMDGDFSNVAGKPGLSTDTKEDNGDRQGPRSRLASSCCSRSCCRRFGCCSFISILVMSVVSWLLRPHDPSWDLIHLDIDVDLFVNAIMGMAPANTPLGLYAQVDFFNPNTVGAVADASTLTLHHGNSTDGELMATGLTTPIDVNPHAIGRVGANVTVTLSEQLSLAIVEEVLANDMKLRVFADVHTVAHFGPLNIKVHVQCKVVAKTMALLEDPVKVIAEKDCTYSYGL